MKKMKKIVSLLLMFVMVAAMAVTASADGHTITISNSVSGYTYVAYQIFSGKVSSGQLTEITWGSALSGNSSLQTTILSDYSVDNVAALAASLIEDNATAGNGEINAADFAKYLAGLSDMTSAGTFTYSAESQNYALSGLSDGYYLVVNTAVPTGSDSTDTVYSNYILKVVGGDVSVTTKSDTPQVDKKVSDVDANIGDTVTYTLTASLPDYYADYSTYKLVFHDTLSKGLTYTDGQTMVVKVYDSLTAYTSDTDGTGGTVVSSGYTSAIGTYDSSSGTSITVTINDTNSLYTSGGSESITVTKDSIIVVTFTADLNSNAVIGGAGNPNTVYLEYSNNPNSSGSTGKTPEDKVITWTYELDVTKVDGTDNNTKLEGAKFKLYKYVDSTKTYATVSSGKVTGWTTNENSATELMSDANGLFTVAGLDVGIYYLTETEAPTGYNKLETDTELTIAATYSSETGTWVSDDATALSTLTVKVGSDNAQDGTTTDGKVGVTVENNSGSSLPETGGMGTTILYVIGTILVLGAAILLVTKKRMSAQR